MAPRKRKPVAKADGANESVPAMEKIARLLALAVTKDMDTDDAALKLDVIGFEAREITSLLGVSDNFVFAARHRSKSKKRRGKSRD